MKKHQKALITRLLVLLAAVSFTVSTFAQDGDEGTADDKKEKMPYQHIIALGGDYPISNGANKFSPLIAYYWFGENFKNEDLYMQFTLTTTTVFFIVGMKNKKIFTGIQPMLMHTVYSGYRHYNRGYSDEHRIFDGNNVGAVAFFEYKWAKIFSSKVYFHPAYYFYRFPILVFNERKTVQLPNEHWQLSPGVELSLKDLEEKNLNRIKHGYLLECKYEFGNRIGYGTWYDYDHLWYKEYANGQWLPLPSYNGVWYKSNVRNTHRLYFTAGGYYNFKHDLNLQFDFYGGYFIGVDRNNAEGIGFYNADHAVMPGYYDSEFQHHFYLISRVQFGVPIPFWDMRLQPGFNILYMPSTNEVIGLQRGVVAGYASFLGSNNKSRYYPERIYKSVSISFSIKLGNFLPFFFDYAYGIDATRTGAAHKVYLGKYEKGSHELRVLVLGAFVENK